MRNSINAIQEATQLQIEELRRKIEPPHVERDAVKASAEEVEMKVQDPKVQVGDLKVVCGWAFVDVSCLNGFEFQMVSLGVEYSRDIRGPVLIYDE